jgi:acyl-CoA thioesterase-1
MSSLDPSLTPFWLSNTMRGESVAVIARGDGTAAGTLLFPPDAVLAVTSASAEVVFIEGADYAVDRAAGRIVRVEGSRMPVTSREALAAADGALTHDRTVAVTYTHEADAPLWRLPDSGGALPRVARLLKRRGPLTICLTGDSISEGYDASGFHRVAPHQPGFGRLVANAVEQQHGAPVQLHNLARAGSTAADALWDTSRIAALKPDLVIVAFGMNDACYADAGDFGANVSMLMQRVGDEAGDAEFVVVSPMLPTPECTWLVATRFEEYRAALAALTGEGVVLADVTELWTKIVARKDPHDLSGNGLNHPNDFGHRLYAQLIVATIAG